MIQNQMLLFNSIPVVNELQYNINDLGFEL